MDLKNPEIKNLEETTKGVCNGVIYPTKRLLVQSKMPKYGPKNTKYYELTVEPIKRFQLTRCDNILL